MNAEALKIDSQNVATLAGRLLRMWHFSPSHDRLAYQLDTPDGSPKAYLIFIGCTNIRGPVIWRLVAPLIEGTGSDLQRFADGSAIDIEHMACEVRSTFEIGR